MGTLDEKMLVKSRLNEIVTSAVNSDCLLSGMGADSNTPLLFRLVQEVSWHQTLALGPFCKRLFIFCVLAKWLQQKQNLPNVMCVLFYGF